MVLHRPVELAAFDGQTRLNKCPVKDCGRVAAQRHHILYDYHVGGPAVRELCSEHHSWITREQSHAARKQRHDLSAKQRWRFFYMLINGEMKRPRITRLDREWSENQSV